MKKLYNIVLICLVVSFAFSSCSNNKDNASSDLYKNENTNIIANEELSQKLSSWQMPFDKYIDTTEKYVNTAQMVLENKCMVKAGFPNYFDESDLQVSADGNKIDTFNQQYFDPEFLNKKYNIEDLGILDIDFAKKYGYDANMVTGQYEWQKQNDGTRNLTFKDEVLKARQKYREQLDAKISSDAEKVKQAHEEDKVCREEAHKVYFDGFSTDNDKLKHNKQINDLLTETKDKATKSAPIIKVLNDYATCMLNKGFDEITGPPMTVFNWDFPKKYSHPKESDDGNKQLAIPDTQCKNDVHLLDIWKEVLTDAENEAINNNLPLFTEQQKYNEIVINYCNDIISKA